MSSENSGASAAASDSDPPRGQSLPVRSPFEKWLVWGGIVGLVALVAVQAHARFGYEFSLQRLRSRLAAEDSLEGKPLFVKEVPGLIVGWPRREVQRDRHWETVVYKWHGLMETYEIHMPYDTTEEFPAVLDLRTAKPPVPVATLPREVAFLELSEEGPPIPSSEQMMAAGGSGRPRRNFLDLDTDGDGKVSREEAPERLRNAFERLDINGDGFLDAEEAAAMRRRLDAGQVETTSTPAEQATEGLEASATSTGEGELPADAAAPANSSNSP